MKLLIIRHAEPNYTKDSLTPKGWREQELLAGRLAQIPIDKFYVSPLGRASDTARDTLAQKKMEAEVKPWLREFDTKKILRPDAGGVRRIPWDWLPEDWLTDERLLDRLRWGENEQMAEAGVKECYDEVTSGLDQLLETHGYRRTGEWYAAERPNHETVAFFCHHGAACVILSHLLHIPVMTLWHGVALLPTSVTTLVTEERRRGKAVFRALEIGSLYHLYAAGEKPSFSARFSECYTDTDECRLD